MSLKVSFWGSFGPKSASTSSKWCKENQKTSSRKINTIIDFFYYCQDFVQLSGPLVLVIQHYLGVRVQGPSPNFTNNIQNLNYKFQKFLCSQYFIIQHFVLQIILYFLGQLESKLMTLIDKQISITFKSVNILKLGKVKKL